jgi:hypothetical protein
MKSVAIAGLVGSVIITLSKHMKELGLEEGIPLKEQFDNMDYASLVTLSSRLLELQEEDEQAAQDKADGIIGRTTMVTIELDLDADLIDKLVEMAKKEILNDRDALINYMIPKIIKQRMQIEEDESGDHDAGHA